MRRCYLVCYDIRDPRRLRRVHKAMKGYGEPWQFSVFFCVLKNIDRVRMQTELEAEMNQRDDQILVIDLGGDEEAARNAAVVLGQAMKPVDSGMVVV